MKIANVLEFTLWTALWSVFVSPSVLQMWIAGACNDKNACLCFIFHVQGQYGQRMLYIQREVSQLLTWSTQYNLVHVFVYAVLQSKHSIIVCIYCFKIQEHLNRCTRLLVCALTLCSIFHVQCQYGQRMLHIRRYFESTQWNLIYFFSYTAQCTVTGCDKVYVYVFVDERKMRLFNIVSWCICLFCTLYIAWNICVRPKKATIWIIPSIVSDNKRLV